LQRLLLVKNARANRCAYFESYHTFANNGGADWDSNAIPHCAAYGESNFISHCVADAGAK
jgi:hypothetical protein